MTLLAQKEGAYAICGQSDLGFRCPLPESLVTVVYINEQRRP